MQENPLGNTPALPIAKLIDQLTKRPLGFALLIVGVFSLDLKAASPPTIQVAIPTQISPMTSPAKSLQWKARSLLEEQTTLPREAHPGFSLAQQHCTSCHLTPEPEHEPRETWPFILNWMSNYLGYPNYGGSLDGLVEHHLIPEQPAISEEQLQQISEYLQLYAEPETTIRQRNQRDYSPIQQFQMFGVSTGIPNGSTVTMIHFDDERDQYFFGWANQSKVRVHDINGKLLMEIPTPSEPIHLETTPTGFQITGIGHFLQQAHLGHVMDIQIKRGTLLGSKTLVEDQTRMTQALREDVDGDQRTDLVLVGFGDGLEGEVSVRWGNEYQDYSEKTVLINYSGGLNAAVHDFNADGLKDIMLLTSQRQQELLIFLNEGNRSFEQHVVLKEFAGFGFNHLALEDFNNDGQIDIILSNGNNAEIDFTPIKPYHGIQILENQGDLAFDQKFQFQLYGATKSISGDFDQDGDPDIATIAFYPDWVEKLPTTFVYFENQGNYEFQPTVVTSNNWGRWISIAKGDVNNDGYPDILLGGGYYPVGVGEQYSEAYLRLINQRPATVLLQNRGSRTTEP